MVTEAREVQRCILGPTISLLDQLIFTPRSFHSAVESALAIEGRQMFVGTEITKGSLIWYNKPGIFGNNLFFRTSEKIVLHKQPQHYWIGGIWNSDGINIAPYVREGKAILNFRYY